MTIRTVGPTGDYVTDGTDDHVQINQAIVASSAGDDVVLNYGAPYPYDIAASVDFKTGVNVRALLSTRRPTVKLDNALSADFGLVGVTVDDFVVENIIIDGNGAAATSAKGIGFDRCDNVVLNNITVMNVSGHNVGVYGCANFEANSLVTSCDEASHNTTSHGVDLDLGAAVAPNGVVFNDCTFQGAKTAARNASCTKAGEGLGIVYNRCTFLSEVIYGDEATVADTEVTYNNCVFDGVLVIGTRTTNYNCIINGGTFTATGGCIKVFTDSGAPFILNGPTFHGRNKIVGHDDLNWFTPVNFIDTDSAHTDNQAHGRPNCFVSYNDNGKPGYGGVYRRPWITPDTCFSNLQEALWDSTVDNFPTNYSLLSNLGEHVPPSSQAVTRRTGQAAAIIDSYPDRATINGENLNGALISDNGPAGFKGLVGALKNVKIRNVGVSTRFVYLDDVTVESDFTVYDCEVTECSNNLPLFEVRGVASGNKLHLRKIEGYGNTSATGGAAWLGYTQDAMLTAEGIWLHDNPIVSAVAALRWYTSAVAGSYLAGGLCHGNDAAMTRFIYNQSVNTFFDAVTNEETENIITILTTASITCRNMIADKVHWSDADSRFKYSGAVLTISDSLIASFSDAGNITDGGNIITEVPTYMDSANDDYQLTDASFGLGVGADINGSLPRRLDANGRVYPDREVDMGGVQSDYHSMYTAD